MSGIEIRLTGPHATRMTHTASGQEITSAIAAEFGGPGGAFSSTDLVAAALGSCIATNLGPVAERHSYPLDAIAINVTKGLTEAPRRIARLDVRIRFAAAAAPDLRARFQQAASSCTVSRSLHPDLDC